MLAAHVLDVAQPVIDQAELVVAQSGQHAAAAVMAADDDVLDLEHIDGELHHREAIEVGVDDDIGDVAMDEHFAGREADDLVGRHPAVGATDPEVAWGLLARKPFEELGVVADHGFRPGAIVRE